MTTAEIHQLIGEMIGSFAIGYCVGYLSLTFKRAGQAVKG